MNAFLHGAVFLLLALHWFFQGTSFHHYVFAAMQVFVFAVLGVVLLAFLLLFYDLVSRRFGRAQRQRPSAARALGAFHADAYLSAEEVIQLRRLLEAGLIIESVSPSTEHQRLRHEDGSFIYDVMPKRISDSQIRHKHYQLRQRFASGADFESWVALQSDDDWTEEAWQFRVLRQRDCPRMGTAMLRHAIRSAAFQDTTPYGHDLAQGVAQYLLGGGRIAYGHRDYCGMGLRFEAGQYEYSAVHDGCGWCAEKTFSTQTEFVNWLAAQSDESLCGRESGDPWYINNQRVVRAALTQVVPGYRQAMSTKSPLQSTLNISSPSASNS